MTEFLTLDDLLAAAATAVAPLPLQVRDFGLMASALARPQATVFGEDAYPTLAGKAAALLSSLVRDHALVEGNQRLGWVATRLFLIMNELDLQTPEDGAFDLVMSVADGSVGVEKVELVLSGWISSARL